MPEYVLATDDDIGCSDPIVQGESSHPVVLLLFSGGDCCAMTPPFFESEFTSWIAESRGGPRWRAYAVVTGSPLWEGDDAVIFVTGTESDSRFIEIALSDEEGPFIQGMIIGTFATGPYVFPPEQLLPWR